MIADRVKAGEFLVEAKVNKNIGWSTTSSLNKNTNNNKRKTRRRSNINRRDYNNNNNLTSSLSMPDHFDKFYYDYPNDEDNIKTSDHYHQHNNQTGSDSIWYGPMRDNNPYMKIFFLIIIEIIFQYQRMMMKKKLIIKNMIRYLI